MNGEGACWSSLSAGSLPAGLLVRLSQQGEELGILLRGLKTRDWAVQLWSLTHTSWSAIWSLCLREQLRLQGMPEFGVRVGLLGYRVLSREWEKLEQSPCRWFACWPASETVAGGGEDQGFAPGPRA